VVKALEELSGIKKANASFPEKKAIVIYDRALVTVEQMNKTAFQGRHPIPGKRGIKIVTIK